MKEISSQITACPARFSNYPRFFCESLFSLNIALVAQLQGNQVPNGVFPFWEMGQFALQFRINNHLHLHPHSRVGGEAAFFIFALTWALFIFLMLRLLSRTRMAIGFLRFGVGIISLLALPIFWLHVGTPPTLPDPPHILLLFEMILAAVFAFLYLFSRWPFPIWSTVFILALHFLFWGWLLMGGIYFWLDPLRPSIAVAGFAATLVWGLYVSRTRATQPTGP